MTKSDLLKKIRLKCLDCCGTSAEVEQCLVTACTLFDVRSGKDPQKRVLSDEKRQALADRLALARKEKNRTHAVEE